MNETTAEDAKIESKSVVEKTVRRKIPGGMPYTSSPGVLSRTLQKIPTAERPSIFSQDFLGTVLGITGGSSRPIIPILKATGLLSPNGAPTELYGQFQSDSGRALAALDALRTGYAELFKRNQFAHKADSSALTDIIVSITGLPKSDEVVRSILKTFEAIQAFARLADDGQRREQSQPDVADVAKEADKNDQTPHRSSARSVGLVYNINIVLPETTNIEVYNAIFRSLKSNIL